MTEPLSVSVLKNKSREIERYISETEKRLAQARTDLIHVNATIRLFEVNGERTQFPVYVNLTRMFRRGEIAKYAEEAIAASADGTATTRQIAAHIVAAKGWDASDRALAASVATRVVNVMAMHVKRGKRFQRVGKRAGVNVWRLAERPAAS